MTLEVDSRSPVLQMRNETDALFMIKAAKSEFFFLGGGGRVPEPPRQQEFLLLVFHPPWNLELDPGLIPVVLKELGLVEEGGGAAAFGL